jgi:hypothetical protein
LLQAGHIAGDFDDVVKRNAGCFLQLEQQQIGKRGLSALDLGGQQGLTPHLGVEEQFGVGQQRGDAIEATAGQQRLLVQGLKGSRQHHRRLSKQWRQYEIPHRFPGGAGDLVTAGGLAPHGPPLTNLEYTLSLFKGTAAPLNKAPGLLRGFYREPLRSMGCLRDWPVPRTTMTPGGVQEQASSANIPHGPFPLLRSLLRHRMGIISGSAFQADDAGSIPAARFRDLCHGPRSPSPSGSSLSPAQSWRRPLLVFRSLCAKRIRMDRDFVCRFCYGCHDRLPQVPGRDSQAGP